MAKKLFLIFLFISNYSVYSMECAKVVQDAYIKGLMDILADEDPSKSIEQLDREAEERNCWQQATRNVVITKNIAYFYFFPASFAKRYERKWEKNKKNN